MNCQKNVIFILNGIVISYTLIAFLQSTPPPTLVIDLIYRIQYQFIQVTEITYILKINKHRFLYKLLSLQWNHLLNIY